MSLRLRASLAHFPSALYNRVTGASLVAATAQSESGPAAACWNRFCEPLCQGHRTGDSGAGMRTVTLPRCP